MALLPYLRDDGRGLRLHAEVRRGWFADTVPGTLDVDREGRWWTFTQRVDAREEVIKVAQDGIRSVELTAKGICVYVSYGRRRLVIGRGFLLPHEVRVQLRDALASRVSETEPEGGPFREGTK